MKKLEVDGSLPQHPRVVLREGAQPLGAGEHHPLGPSALDGLHVEACQLGEGGPRLSGPHQVVAAAPLVGHDDRGDARGVEDAHGALEGALGVHVHVPQHGLEVGEAPSEVEEVSLLRHLDVVIYPVQSARLVHFLVGHDARQGVEHAPVGTAVAGRGLHVPGPSDELQEVHPRGATMAAEAAGYAVPEALIRLQLLG